MPVVPAFDGYRAFAILGVVMLHVASISGVAQVGVETLAARMIWGTLGHAVELLFIVSGFVVFLPTVARKGDFGSVKSFALRRAARLLPAYWLILLISLPLIATFEPAYSELPGLRDLLLNFTALMVPAGLFVSGIGMGFGLNPPLWTLSVEVSFYIVLPLVAVAFYRRPLTGVLLSLLVTVGWTITFDHVDAVMEFLGRSPDFDELVRLHLSSGLQLPAWAYSFGLGMFGAWLWVRLQDQMESSSLAAKRAPTIVMTASVVMLIPLVWLLGGYYDQTRESLVLSILFSTLIATFMVALALCPSRVQAPVALPAVRRLGDISYGIYLSHLVIAYTIASEISLPRDGNLWSLVIWTAAVVPASVLYGYLSARFLEQPIRRWARKYGRARADEA